ncbi:hypothetical protein DFJ74DRAFT_766691 [Hyaloraphidium curvatum]|nr:hypothetical protein DFJ74DRAFT_766691 [Hyaloraphidium curvatum]
MLPRSYLNSSTALRCSSRTAPGSGSPAPRGTPSRPWPRWSFGVSSTGPATSATMCTSCPLSEIASTPGTAAVGSDTCAPCRCSSARTRPRSACCGPLRRWNPSLSSRVVRSSPCSSSFASCPRPSRIWTSGTVATILAPWPTRTERDWNRRSASPPFDGSKLWE